MDNEPPAAVKKQKQEPNYKTLYNRNLFANTGRSENHNVMNMIRLMENPKFTTQKLASFSSLWDKITCYLVSLRAMVRDSNA